MFGTLPQSDVRLQLEIDWHNVNEPVASNVFDWKEWDLPNGTVIYDDRLHGDKKVILAVAGKSLEVELAPLQGQRNSSPFVRQLIVLNSIALGAAFGYVAMKWIGKRSAAIRLAKSADVVPTRESTT